MISRSTQLAWSYRDADPDESFNKRVGTILNRGMPFPCRPDSAPVGTTRSERYREKAAVVRKITPPALRAPVAVDRTENGLPDFSNQGHGWVDEKGTTLHDGIRDERPSAQALPPSARPSTCMPMNRRTQDLWKRTNPGIMHQYIKTPCSSSHDHYQWDEDQIDEKTRTNWMRHRSKTEFSKYVEADSRLKQLVRGKGHNA